MSMITVFLTVAFITLIDCLSGIIAVPPLQLALAMGGDFDLILTANMGRLKAVKKSTNYFTDEFYTFSANFMNDRAAQNFQIAHHIKAMNPFINYTEINAHMEGIYAELDKPMDVELTPRWIAQTRVFNTDRTFNTSSYMVAGDSIRERNIGIAPGFPI